MIIFRLSEKLGGRSEVLKTPIMELLGHMMQLSAVDKAEAEKEQYERYINFLSMTFSNPSDGEDKEFENARKQFIESLKPDFMKQPTLKPRETDIDMLKRIRDMQMQQKGG